MLRAESLFLRSGKVRDLYRVDDARLLLVASDRISAFDVVLPTPIPDKGRVLTGLSRFWFRETAGIVPNHLLATDPAALPPALVADAAVAAELRGRMMIGRRADVLPVECVVRGYLAGSAWKEYRESGAVCGIELPPGLRQGDRLPEPVFTPAWKAPAGVHDENIPFSRVVPLIGHELAVRVREAAFTLYRHGAATCERAGILLADTKFEFGLDPGSGELLLVDEVLTPDSSRFWDAATYEPGRSPASYDKQYVRDWLEAQAWDMAPPGPALPDDVVAGTRARYVEAFERITGASFARYLEEDVVAP
jgi:phosphoribosylaminoimidazole-succinocarboxamide synthase